MPKFALSIRQPWAWAILNAGKDIENRDWPTAQRGAFYIHAAKGMSRTEYDDFCDFYERAIRSVQRGLPPAPLAADLPRGGIIGQAKLVDCVRRHPSPWFFGKYGFVLSDVRALRLRPLRGQLGFFTVDDDVGEP